MPSPDPPRRAQLVPERLVRVAHDARLDRALAFRDRPLLRLGLLLLDLTQQPPVDAAHREFCDRLGLAAARILLQLDVVPAIRPLRDDPRRI